MTSDHELLRRYAQTRAEAAFAELVQRQVHLVYSAALRQVHGDAHLAQDVCQSVFADLARKAAGIIATEPQQSLTGWLYTSTHYAAAKAIRTESRRRHREEKFMRETTSEPAGAAALPAAGADLEWERLRPELDAAMHELKAGDRDALLLRFFEKKSFAEVGARLQLTENAARMRVERALDKLRAAFARRGVAVSGTLATAISANAVQLAPAGLAASLISTSLMATTGAVGGVSILKYLVMTKLQTGILGAILIAGIATPVALHHAAEVKLQQQKETLRQRDAELARLTAENARLQKLSPQARNPSFANLAQPPAQLAAAALKPAPDDTNVTNLMLRLMKGEVPQLTPEQIDAYLKQNHRSAASLLAVYRSTGDAALLREALEKYPNDPKVNFAAVFDKTATPAELRDRLEAFKKSAPDNSLPNYLSALNYFNSGDSTKAVQELNAARGKSGFQDYSWDFVQNAEEAWRSAGYSEAETKMIATWQLMLPQLGQLSDLDHQVVNLAQAYAQAGDITSAQAALQMNISLGQSLDGSARNPLITQLVGLAIERDSLAAMDPNGVYGSDGTTVKQRLDQLTQQSASIKALCQQMDTLQESMSPQDWINYNERTKTFGEMNALQWLLAKYGQK